MTKETVEISRDTLKHLLSATICYRVELISLINDPETGGSRRANAEAMLEIYRRESANAASALRLGVE